VRVVHRAVLLAFAAPIAAALLCTCSAAQPPAPVAPTAPEHLTGTVTAVHAQPRSFDLVTAVGHALRSRRILQPAGVTVEAHGAAAAPAALYPGCVVRVECRSGPTGAVASKIELLRAPPARP